MPLGSAYDPRGVRQRFDLTGSSRIGVPMVIDLEEGSALWTDIHLPPAGGYHSVAVHSARLGLIARHLFERYADAGRVTLWDLSVWHAAARTDDVAVLRRTTGVADRKDPDNSPGPGRSGEVWTYRRAADETRASFAARIRTGGVPDSRTPAEDTDATAARTAAGKHVLLCLVDGTAAPHGATGALYRLYPGPVDAVPGLRRLAAGDLVAALETGAAAPAPDDGGSVAVSGGPYPQ
ncbi:hypothetical protein ACWC2K_33320 [Streptomyces chattanoogensis]